MMIEFRALGPLVVLNDGSQVSVGGARQRRLLAMLLIHRNSVVSVDRLVDAVFAGQPTDGARTTIRSYIARVRRAIGDGTSEAALLTEPPGYSLRAIGDVVDVGRFEALSADGNRLLADGDADQAAQTFGAALGLWRGRAYEEFDDEDWAQPEAQRLEELRLVTEERLIEAELACGKAADVIARLETLIVLHPLRETFRAQLMLALYRSGRQVDALRSYRDYRSTLADEVGIDPSRSLAELEQSILAHDPTLDLTEAAGRALRGYRLGVRIGLGPNGAIHRARVPGVDADAALSILRDPRVDEVEFVRSFDSNANLLASLRHPSVVPVQDYWREPGAAYVVTRLPTGISLRDRLQRGPIARREIVALVRQIGGALSEAAALGTRHGGISLDNIWIDENATASIAHFAICPSGADTDVHDFGRVIRACVDRCDQEMDPVWRDAIETEIDSAQCGSMHQFVDRVGAALREQLTDGVVDRRNPFKGLRSFDESDAGDFFGRDDWVDQLVARVDVDRLTLVVGGSGSGKSSVVRAALVPRVRSGSAFGANWFVTTMMPGSAPFKELGEALRRVAVGEPTTAVTLLRNGARSLDQVVHDVLPTGARLLLVIDQFEELFTLTSDAEHRAFLDVLADSIEAPCGRVHVVATLRADFYDRPLAYQRFGALAAAATLPLPAMTPACIEAAIVGPLTRIGASAEPALVAELVSAVVDQPSALPSLQFTLFELAGRRPDRCLKLADYSQLGGVEQAIAGRAEYLYRSLDRPGQDVVRRVFEQLVSIGVDAEPTGRRRERADLATGPTATEVQEMIDHWTAARLLTGDHDPRSRVPTVQLAHEAILTSWPRLRQWIDDDRHSIIAFDHIRSAAAEWSESGRDPAMLYRGARLQAALDLGQSHPQFVPAIEREFLAAGVDLRDREGREAAERLEQQARANRRLRLQLGAIAAALVLALVVGFIAVEQRGNAQRQRDTAEAARQEAQAERDAAETARRETQTERDAADAARRNATARELAAAADANVDVDPERAIHLALLAIDQTRSVDGTVVPQAVDALHHAVSSTRILLNVPDVGGRLDWSPTDDIFVTEGPEESGIIDVRNATTGESVTSFRGDAVDVNDVVFSPDGTMLAVVGDDGTAKVFNPYTGALLYTVEGSGTSWDPSFNDDGTMLLTNWAGMVSEDAVVRLTDLSTGMTAEEETSSPDVRLSPDGTLVAGATDMHPPVVVVDVATLETVAEIEGDDTVGELRWSPDGSKIATAGGNGGVEVFDADSGERLAVARHDAHVLILAWSRDGTRLATGSYDGTARVWKLDGNSLTEEFRFQVQDFANGVAGIAFSPDGDRLAVSDFDITSTKVFDLRAGAAGELATLPADARLGAAFTPDTGDVLIATPKGAITVGDPDTGQTVRTIGVGASWPGFRLSPDGDAVAVGSAAPGELRLLDTSNGAPLSTIDLGEEATVDAFAWSPDGEYVALAAPAHDYRDTELVVVDRAGGRVGSWILPNTWIRSLAFSADGRRLGVARAFRDRVNNAAETVQLWDWRRAEVVGELNTKALDIRFDPSGRYIATTRFNQGEGDVWDSTTLERVSTLFGSQTPLSALAFSADGSRLATGSQDGMVRIWDPATGLQQQRLDIGHGVADVAFAPDGQRLLTTDLSGVARVWELDLDRLIAIAESRLTRDLTDGECLQYLGSASC